MPENLLNERDVLDRIRLEMGKHLRETQAPEDIHGFLVQNWARLMTGIFMAKGNQDPDWAAGWDTVNALLWSLSPKQSRVETEKMLRMLPTILARLQEGCAALGVAAVERDVFFERLAMMHAAVARAGLKFHDGPAVAVTRMGTAPEAEPDADLARLLPQSSPQPMSAGQSPEDSPEAASMPELKTGVRVSFKLPKQDKILILNWVSPVGGMYMFANEHGLDALTLTRARLLEKFRAGDACLA